MINWLRRRSYILHLLFLAILVLSVIYGVVKWRDSPPILVRYLLFYISFLIALYTVPQYVTRRLGLAAGILTNFVMYGIVLYVFLFLLIKFGEFDLPSSMLDVGTLAISVVVGLYASELKYPSRTLGDVIRSGGWTSVYRAYLATPSLVMVATFGSLQIIDHIVDLTSEDNSSVAFLAPIACIVLVALFEFIRREVRLED